MEILKKWLFRTSTAEVENLDISHEDDATEVDEFVNEIITKIQMNKSTKQYRTRSMNNENNVINAIINLCDVPLTDDGFIENANSQLLEVAKRLVRIETEVDNQSGHLNEIQKGELLLVLLRDEEEQVDKFLLSKVEVVSMLKTDDVSIARGIIKEVKRLWKSCLFTLAEIEGEAGDNYYLADVYSNNNSTYWHHRFLSLEEMTDDEVNTKRSFNAIDKLLGKEVKKYFPNDYQILRNAFVNYYRRGGRLDYNDMVSEVVRSYHSDDEKFNDEFRDNLFEEFEKLPNKKSGGFDTIFESKYAVLNVRIKKTLPLRQGLSLVITDAIDNIEHVIQAKEDPTHGKQLIINIDDQETFDSFKRVITMDKTS